MSDLQFNQKSDVRIIICDGIVLEVYLYGDYGYLNLPYIRVCGRHNRSSTVLLNDKISESQMETT